MKTDFTRALTLAIALLIANIASAYDFIVDNFAYNVLDANERTVEVTQGCDYSGEIVIPETVVYDDVEYYVTSIGEKAFYDCNSLTSVNAAKIKTIGNQAFRECYSLRNLDLSSIESIGDDVFADPWAGLISLRIGSIVQWCNVSFGSGYSNPVGRYYYIIPDLKLFIGDSDTSATEIIDEDVTIVPSNAFSAIGSLTKVKLPNAISVGSGAFCGCNSLESVDLPLVEQIGASAFAGCTALESVSLPEAKVIGENAFGEILDLIEDNNGSYFKSIRCEKLTGIDLPEAIEISSRAFVGCSALETVSLPKVKIIGKHAFGETSDYSWGNGEGHNKYYYCEKLTSINLPNVESIGEGAFYYCSSLTSVDLPNVTSIGNHAFYNCSSLTTVDLTNVTSIGEEAFSDCSNISSLRIGSVEQWCNVSFGNNYSSNPLLVTNKEMSLYIGDSETPVTEISDDNVTIIPDYAFYRCSSIISVNLPNVASIGECAFYNCSSLTSMDLPNVTSIGNYAFVGSSNISSLRIGSVERWCNVSFGDTSNPLLVTNKEMSLYIGDSETPATDISDDNVTIIPDYAFYRCSSIISVNLPNVASIGEFAFYDCSSLTSVELPNVTFIGDGAFFGCSSLTELNLDNQTPPTIGNNIVPKATMITVPESAYDTYISSPGFCDIPLQVVIKEYSNQNVHLTASDNSSALLAKIGSEDKAKHVVYLKISGTINSYDMMVMRNKMTGLRNLDLADAIIVANPYEYYTGYGSQDNVVGDYWMCERLYPLMRIMLPKSAVRIGKYAFKGCNDLIEVTLSEGLQAIDNYAFSYCNKLNTINLPEGLQTIDSNAFYNCSSLQKINIPNSVEGLGGYAFYRCSALSEVTLGKNLKGIGSYAFSYCSNLQKIELPTYIEYIDDYAFSRCTSLTEVLIPAALRRIGNYAFSGCSNLNTVVATTVEPININQNTFATYPTASLYAPKTSYWTYYYNTQWSQFLAVKEYSELKGVPFRYEYFYINNDFTVNEDNGTFEGEPDADFNEGSGFTADEVVQELGEVHLKHNGNNGASVIGKGQGKVHVSKLIVDIKVNKNRWYFFTFPFDLESSNIKYDASYVWYKYDGEARANGNSGWKKVGNDRLEAGQGYIFQGAVNGTLTIEKEDVTVDSEDLTTSLITYNSGNKNDASWNLIGNPCTAYYDMDDTGYEAPITVYNSDSGQYEAVRPGDDDYTFYPFQAFFVQKPEGVETVTFDNDGCVTKMQSERLMAAKAVRRKAKMAEGSPRKLINLTMTDGKTTDKTRVVINNEKSMDYELDCDAAKFIDNSVPQIYTVDAKGTQYAINERPEGNGKVKLVVNVPKEGEYTVAVTRSDCPVILRDLLIHKDINIAEGQYSFALEKGLQANRFELVVGGEATAVKDVEAVQELVSVEDGEICVRNTSAEVKVYTVGGSLVATQKGTGSIKVATGTYIVKIGDKSQKVSVN